MEVNKILKSDYLDILFEGRNKTYGGYELRRNYPQRVRNAMIIIGGIFLLFMGYGVLANMKKAEPVRKKPIVSTVTLAPPPPMDKDKPKPPPPPPAPPPPAKPTVKFTPPVIKPDEQVKEDEKPTPPDKDKHEIAGPVNAAGDEKGTDLAPTITAPTGTGNAVEAPKNEDKVFQYVEQQAKFNGDVGRWLSDHLEYPEAEQSAEHQGKVYIQFIVSKDGSISEATVQKSSGYPALDKEAIRAVKKMPPWTPAKNNGEVVKSYFSLPVVFQLQ